MAYSSEGSLSHHAPFRRRCSSTIGPWAAAIVACTAFCAPRAAEAATYVESFSADGGAYLAEWGVVGDRIDFRLTATTPGWVAVGFSDNQLMPLSDVIMGAVEGNVPSLQDSWATGYSAPPPDTIDDVTLNAGSEEAGTTILEFSRLLDTGDTENDYDLNTPRYLLWAYNSFSESFTSYHSSNRGFSPTPINFSEAVVPEPGVTGLLLIGLAGAVSRRAPRARTRRGR